MTTDEEYTFIMMKPDALERGLTDEVLSYFSDSGLQPTMLEQKNVSSELVDEHYGHVPGDVLDELHDYFDDEDVMVGIMYGEDAVKRTREIVGDEFRPEENEPGTIRGDAANNPESPLYDEDLLPHYDSRIADTWEIPLFNIVHASTSQEEAHEEAVRFYGEEIEKHL
ncbi:MAG: hypothetical protein H8Z69_01035 [Nanohaloarchaea archaeon]|nr:hypothetical protein [Candidatus Nanohaloarchaea archaeon]